MAQLEPVGTYTPSRATTEEVDQDGDGDDANRDCGDDEEKHSQSDEEDGHDNYKVTSGRSLSDDLHARS